MPQYGGHAGVLMPVLLNVAVSGAERVETIPFTTGEELTVDRFPTLHVRVFGMFTVAFVLSGCAYAYSLMGQMPLAVGSLALSVALGVGVVRAALTNR